MNFWTEKESHRCHKLLHWSTSGLQYCLLTTYFILTTLNSSFTWGPLNLFFLTFNIQLSWWTLVWVCLSSLLLVGDFWTESHSVNDQVGPSRASSSYPKLRHLVWAVKMSLWSTRKGICLKMFLRTLIFWPSLPLVISQQTWSLEA